MACTDPVIFVRGVWGDGGSRPDGENTALKILLFFLCVFLSPQLILQFTEGANGFITEITTFPRNQRGSNIFQGSVPTFYRVLGVQILISVELHITCDFQG